MLEQLRKSLDEEITEIWPAVGPPCWTPRKRSRSRRRKSDITVDAFGLAWVPSWHVVGKVDGVEQRCGFRRMKAVSGNVG